MDRKKLAFLKNRMERVMMDGNGAVAWEKYLRDKIVELLEILIDREEPKPVVSDLTRSSYVFDVDFSCFSCQQVLSHLTRRNSKTKVRLCMGVDKKTWHFLEELEENV